MGKTRFIIQLIGRFLFHPFASRPFNCLPALVFSRQFHGYLTQDVGKVSFMKFDRKLPVIGMSGRLFTVEFRQGVDTMRMGHLQIVKNRIWRHTQVICNPRVGPFFYPTQDPHILRSLRQPGYGILDAAEPLSVNKPCFL